MKPLPLIVTAVPPACGPLLGLTPVTTAAHPGADVDCERGGARWRRVELGGDIGLVVAGAVRRAFIVGKAVGLIQ